ncbi:ABSCISIC ACID-INSENSITIVE 5-like protein 2 [Forsythia ovata]|uniref:ABSCISIC ACID-INSENSITIVE 5-like protein 2 n=1 Tax=Forsythia ovata TaxID=205694 RepID=A0ABD1R3C6_9LAMI
MESEGSNSPDEAETQNQDPKFNPITGQGYLYDVVHNHLGDLGKTQSSKNVDELPENVWASEANNQPMRVVDCESTVNQPALDDTSLNRKSSLPLSRELNKTVNGVWQDIQQGQSNLGRTDHLGEMTLEDFLANEREVNKSSPRMINSGSVLGGVDPLALLQQDQWTKYHIPTIYPQQKQSTLRVFMPGHPVQQPIPSGENLTIDATYSERETIMSPSLARSISDTQMPGRWRVDPGVNKKRIEMRQKRRESTASSQARKQCLHVLDNLLILLTYE